MNTRDQVVQFLKSHRSIDAVNFKFRTYKIWPDAYRKNVANALARGDIKIGSAVNDNAAATYRQDQDRLEISPTANFASTKDLGLILHECTHAIIDMGAIGVHSGHEDEAVAYLAEAFFLIRADGAKDVPEVPVPLSANAANGEGIRQEAKRIALKALRNNMYCIEEKDGANLVLLIAEHPHYYKMTRYPSNRFHRNLFYSFLRNI
ncbi:hypothetical protein [Frateuria sp.]|uniref:hypothetical protein n=1 Tax=Frateuria sp. TaxID=2211372 RepID=UPI0017DEAB9E|nr:hypothetical protein [Frateuria sp.]NUR22201.1 hypothetical protein [Frateuria sp.]